MKREELERELSAELERLLNGPLVSGRCVAGPSARRTVLSECGRVAHTQRAASIVRATDRMEGFEPCAECGDLVCLECAETEAVCVCGLELD